MAVVSSTNPYQAAVLDLDRTRGDTAPFRFALTDSDGNAIDDTGFSYKMECSSEAAPTDETDHIFELTHNGDGTGIAVFSPDAADVDYVDTYFYHVRWTDASTKTRTFLKGKIVFTQNIVDAGT